jgi:hypothetical protein
VKTFLALCGFLTASGFIAASAFTNHAFFGWLGVLPVAVNTLCPFWLFHATQKTLRISLFALWFCSLLYSFTAAVGFAAMDRQETTNAKTATYMNYEMELKTLQELEGNKKTPHAKVIQQRAKVAEMRQKGALNEGQPHITLIARFTTLSTDTVKIIYLFLFGFIVEVGSAVTLFASLQHLHKPKPKFAWNGRPLEEEPPLKVIDAKPVSQPPTPQPDLLKSKQAPIDDVRQLFKPATRKSKNSS